MMNKKKNRCDLFGFGSDSLHGSLLLQSGVEIIERSADSKEVVGWYSLFPDFSNIKFNSQLLIRSRFGLHHSCTIVG